MKRFFTVLLITLICWGTAAAAPQFELVGGPVDMGNDGWQFEYKLSNYGGPVPIYDIEFEYSIAAAWITVNGPDGWAMNWQGPMAAWQTESAPCDTEGELGGFYIYAGGPEYGFSPITFTDQAHQVCAIGEAELPIPEPGSLFALGSGLVGLAGSLLRRRR